jgi:hypothetical protein
LSNRRKTHRTGPFSYSSPPAPVWGRDDLVCPESTATITRLHVHAMAHPWPGDTPLDCPGHRLSTTAITEPGRPVRLIYTLDYGYHQSGWFANSDYEHCLHLSLSHPRPDRTRLWAPRTARQPVQGIDCETPSDDEARAWGRVFWREHATKAWFEPAVGVSDPYRLPGVVHLRLYLDQQRRPMIPSGEVYTLRPFADGSSPTKIIEGRAGADVR